MKCEPCGELLVSRPTLDGTRRYVCAKGPGFSGCGHTYIMADESSSSLPKPSSTGSTRPSSPPPSTAAPTTRTPSVCRLQVDEEQAQLDELARLRGEKQIGLSEWLAARAPIEQRLTAARKQLGRLGRATVLDGHVGNASALRRALGASLDLTRQARYRQRYSTTWLSARPPGTDATRSMTPASPVWRV